MLILDTNIVSELLRANPKYTARWYALPDSASIYITPISVFEILMKGRYQALLTAANREQLLVAYDRLTEDERLLREFDTLPITTAVAKQFEKLICDKKLKKAGRADLLIACIALAHDATLVTRNTKDFQAVPNLKLDNWAN
jgi:tRNA(fMet)-specific endonuclease VapC